MSPRPLFAAVIAAALLASAAFAIEPDRDETSLAEVFGGLSLRVNDESAPAGSIVQIKIDVTEPKPISTGKGKVKVKGLTAVEGIALMNRDQDTYGVALVNGDELTFSIHSPSSLFGTEADYPIVAVAGRVAGANAGTTFPLTLDAGALRFLTPAGTEYPLEVKNGVLTVEDAVTIGDVSPGSTVVPAGGTVHITGTNFNPDTRIQLSETAVASTHYISSTRIDVVLAQRTNMHGLRIRARNDKSESEYFSYERTRTATPSSDSILGRAVPLFAPATYTTATVPLPRPAGGKRRATGSADITATANGSGSHATTGFALQNLGTATASATVELLDARGNPYAINTVTIGPDRYLVRGIAEVFGTVVPPAAVRITSTTPLQVLGIVADHSNDTATAVPPG